MPIKYVSPDTIYDIARIIKTDASGQPTEIMKVYRNNAVVWTKKFLDERLKKTANNVAYLINQERAKLGLNSLYVVPYLNECAEIRAKDQLERESHYRPNGDYFSELIDTDKISWLHSSENIALGTSSAEDAVNAWKNSSNHWTVAMNGSFTHTGVGVYYDENSKYKWHWVQIFTNDITPGTVYEGQYLPQYIILYDKLIIKCVDSETGENISGLDFVLYSDLDDVETPDFSATQNGVEISVMTLPGMGMLKFFTGKFPTEISGILSCKLQITISKSSLKKAGYNYNHGLDEESSYNYSSTISIQNNFKTHEFTIVLTKQQD